jgi:hypothetical protein
MTIGQALDYLLQGRKLHHQSWEKNSYIRYENRQFLCCDSKTTWNMFSCIIDEKFSKGWELHNQRLGNLKAGQKFILVDTADKTIYTKPAGIDHYGLYDGFRLKDIHSSTPVEVVE